MVANAWVRWLYTLPSKIGTTATSTSVPVFKESVGEADARDPIVDEAVDVLPPNTEMQAGDPSLLCLEPPPLPHTLPT